MPLVEDNIEDIPREARKYIPDWFFDHTWLGYQNSEKGVIIYRLPTLRECVQYHKGSLFNPPRACQLFINKIALFNGHVLEELDPREVGDIVAAILKECYPTDDSIFDIIDKESLLYDSSLTHAMETFTKSIGDESRIWDLNIREAAERVGLAQVILGQRIKPDEQTNQRQRRQQPAAN